jgi:hypothetical protein
MKRLLYLVVFVMAVTVAIARQLPLNLTLTRLGAEPPSISNNDGS